MFYYQTNRLPRALTKNTIWVTTCWNQSLRDKIIRKSVWNLKAVVIKRQYKFLKKFHLKGYLKQHGAFIVWFSIHVCYKVLRWYWQCIFKSPELILRMKNRDKQLFQNYKQTSNKSYTNPFHQFNIMIYISSGRHKLNKSNIKH